MSRRHPLPPASPLLITECQDEFDRLRNALNQEIRPRGIIERMHVDDIAYYAWEIRRLRRCKACVINTAFRAALGNLLAQLLRNPRHSADEAERAAVVTADKWFADPEKTQEMVSELLAGYQLDESAIMAEAIRQSSPDLQQIDRMLASMESRRSKTLRCIEEYRGGFARQLRQSTNRIIDGKFLALEHNSNKNPTEAA